MKAILSVLISFLIYSQVSAQTVARGYVYEDTNENNKKERREKGIPGVSVSNGVDVVQTDSKGYYELPVGNDNILFVIKPSGYKVPLNNLNQPLYYYIHKPLGSPADFKYKGSEPTGKLPKSVDFALIPYDEPTTFTSLIFGDPQAYNLEEIDYFSKGIIAELEGIENIGFGLSLGDLVGDDLVLHNPY